MKLISWIVSLLVTILLVCFALANREAVSIGFWPLVERLELRLFVAILAAGFIGFLAGGLVAWSAQSRWRRLARERGRRADRLAEEVRRLEARLAGPPSGERAVALQPAAPALREVAGTRT